MIAVHQRHAGQTDRQTDGHHTLAIPSHTTVCRGEKVNTEVFTQKVKNQVLQKVLAQFLHVNAQVLTQ